MYLYVLYYYYKYMYFSGNISYSLVSVIQNKSVALISYLKWSNELIQLDRPIIPHMIVLFYRLDIPDINFPLVVFLLEV